MKITYYLEIISSWCHWVEPTWAELKKRYSDRIDFQWKIALMPPEAFPVSQEQCDWFYRRSGTYMRSPVMLNHGWFEAERKGNYDAPNLVAEAGRDFGFTDDRLRLALSNAAVLKGKKIGDMAVAVAVASEATGIDARQLRARAETTEIRARVQASTDEFLAHQIDQRPAFIITSEIGDKAVFSGTVNLQAIDAAIQAQLADLEFYASYATHFGKPPQA